MEKRTLDGTTSAANVASDFANKAGDGKNILVGESVTWIYQVRNTGNVTLTNPLVSDDLLGVIASYTGDNGNGKLDVGETWYYTKVGTATAGAYSNEGTATGTYVGGTTTASDDSSYFGAKPTIDVEKYVWVGQYEADGVTKIWVDADSPTGPTLLATSGINPQFKFVVVNTGNVALSNVTLSDSVFDLNGAAAGTAIAVGSLAVGDGVAGGTDTYEFIYTGATWQLGQHSNTATASGTYTDDAGHSRTPQDTDAAHYYGTYGAFVTNSSLCTFDTNASAAGKQFNLLFTPDFTQGGGNYKISDTNPGQFYYNMFYNGAANSTITVDLDIPYPFVTQGAVPIHVYDDVQFTTVNGQTCLTPIGEIAGYKLTDAGVNWLYIDANNNNKQDVGDVYRLTINNVSTGDDGFIYLNLHLDYGLEKQSGWVKSSPSSGIDNALDNPNLASVLPDIRDNTAYTFSADVNGVDLNGSTDTIINDNIFKTIKGVGGLFQSDRSDTFLSPGLDHTAVKGQHIYILKASDNSVMGHAYTDADGWYFTQFLATGSKTDYKAVWDQDNDNDYLEHLNQANHVKTFAMGGSAGKWAEASFTVVDPVDTAVTTPIGVIDAYGWIL